MYGISFTTIYEFSLIVYDILFGLEQQNTGINSQLASMPFSPSNCVAFTLQTNHFTPVFFFIQNSVQTLENSLMDSFVRDREEN